MQSLFHNLYKNYLGLLHTLLGISTFFFAYKMHGQVSNFAPHRYLPFGSPEGSYIREFPFSVQGLGAEEKQATIAVTYSPRWQRDVFRVSGPLQKTAVNPQVTLDQKSPEWMLGKRGDWFLYTWDFSLQDNFHARQDGLHLFHISPLPAHGSSPVPLLSFSVQTFGEQASDWLFLGYRPDAQAEVETFLMMQLSDIAGRRLRASLVIQYEKGGTIDFRLDDVNSGREIYRFSDTDIDTWWHNSQGNKRVLVPTWGIIPAKNLLDPTPTSPVMELVGVEVRKL